MSQRRSVSGRPSGTDGSDFSYRMVVDSRYQKVAEGKSRLSALIFTQALIQILEAAILFLFTPKGEPLDRFYVSSSVICYVSLLIGELGRKRSRSTLLKLYLFGSSIAAVISVAFLIKSEKLYELVGMIDMYCVILPDPCKGKARRDRTSIRNVLLAVTER